MTKSRLAEAAAAVQPVRPLRGAGEPGGPCCRAQGEIAAVLEAEAKADGDFLVLAEALGADTVRPTWPARTTLATMAYVPLSHTDHPQTA